MIIYLEKDLHLKTDCAHLVRAAGAHLMVIFWGWGPFPLSCRDGGKEDGAVPGALGDSRSTRSFGREEGFIEGSPFPFVHSLSTSSFVFNVPRLDIYVIHIYIFSTRVTWHLHLLEFSVSTILSLVI